jgi:hypothetical protein
MTLEDRTYYLRRALQEDEAARVAACAQARGRHLELASAYRLRCLLAADTQALKERTDEVVHIPAIVLPAA